MRYLSILLSFALASAAHAETITVAAAISMKDALTKVADAYAATSSDRVEFTFGSSGQLAAQIQAGAPIDLFVSAANKQVDDLSKARLVVDASRQIIASNDLVAVVPADAKSVPASLSDLTGADIKQLAIGETKSVPAGQYAEQSLRHARVFDAVQGKLVFGTNVRQVLDYVERGEVTIGLVYATDAKLSGDKVRIAFTVPANHHEPIVYPAVVIAASAKQDAAKRFLAYLSTEPARRELDSFGFAAPPASPVPATTGPSK